MALATPALAQLEAPVAHRIEQTPLLSSVYESLNDFFAAEFAEPDEMIAGLHRGEVAFLTSDEAQSKTHLLLQMALGLAGGQAVLPWSPKDNTPRRIFYVSSDAAASRIRAELQAMMPHIVDAETAQTNIRLLTDAQLHRQPLNLYRDSHWQWFSSLLKQYPADLIIIDGMREPLTLTGRSSAAARLQLLRHARQLAADFDCAVLVATTSARRKPLTGTALAAIADTLYQLLSDQRRGEDYRQWRCPQSRWVLPEALDLQRDGERRGYQLWQAETKTTSERTSRTEVIDLVQEREAVRRAELMQRFGKSAALQSLAYSASNLPPFSNLSNEQSTSLWQAGKREGEQPLHNAKTVADEDEEEKQDTLPGFTIISAANLFSQKAQTSQRRHKRRSKKQRRHR